ncbi:MAG: SagB/ThcOx family dehydrogenase [Candidatus Thermoplasmatota archaeon]|nr:SagB/ThcOx family dehydrogenase [Candidatus Thermoplasmatota archaeon]
MTREFLKDSIRKMTDFSITDQSRGVAPPPLEKGIPPGSNVIPLPPFEEVEYDLVEAISMRRSHRSFSGEGLSLSELSFLLWATQGVGRRGVPYRTVPSAGCRHAFETYIAAFDVEGLGMGIYRYLPLEHGIIGVGSHPDLRQRMAMGAFGQSFAGSGACTFVWTAIPYRMEWRYGPASYKVIALDAGHVCENLYLACEGIGCGTCAIAAYDQEYMDLLLGIDGDEEFTIYIAPVGKVRG